MSLDLLYLKFQMWVIELSIYFKYAFLFEF